MIVSERMLSDHSIQTRRSIDLVDVGSGKLCHVIRRNDPDPKVEPRRADLTIGVVSTDAEQIDRVWKRINELRPGEAAGLDEVRRCLGSD